MVVVPYVKHIITKQWDHSGYNKICTYCSREADKQIQHAYVFFPGQNFRNVTARVDKSVQEKNNLQSWQLSENPSLRWALTSCILSIPSLATRETRQKWQPLSWRRGQLVNKPLKWDRWSLEWVKFNNLSSLAGPCNASNSCNAVQWWILGVGVTGLAEQL